VRTARRCRSSPPRRARDPGKWRVASPAACSVPAASAERRIITRRSRL
jgi:hypothetical protein